MALSMLEAKRPQIEIADAVNCSIRQIKRIKKNKANWGMPTAPKLVPQGRPHALIEEEVFVCFNPPLFDCFVDVNSCIATSPIS
jgi:hypothetical protein